MSAPLPLDAYLDSMVGFEESDAVARQIAVEEAVARCMSDEGFEYTVPDVASWYSDAVHGSDEEAGTREWISTNGYGLTEKAGTTPVDASEPDPNSAYVQTLSGPSAAAYTTALNGLMADPDVTEEEILAAAPEDLGCRGIAEQEASEPNVWEQPEFESLADAYRVMLEATAESTEISDADTAWAHCMSDAGHPGLAAPVEALASIESAVDEAWAPVDTASDPDAKPAPAVLTELKDLEIATALADLTCREDTGYDDAVRAVKVAAEEQFVADHEAELDALLAASEQQTADE